MKKYKISVLETLAFNHEITLESDTSDIDKILDEAQKERCLDDVILTLEEKGCNVLNVDKDDGSYGEIEIDDYEEMED